MSSSRIPASLRPLVIQDPRLATPDSIWDDESAYETANPAPGVPQPDQATEMVLVTTGEQAAVNYDILTQRAGMPDPGGATFLWKYDTDAADEYRGHDHPHVMHAWESVDWADDTILHSPRELNDPHAITLSDGTVIAVAQARTVLAGNTTYRVYAYVRDPDTDDWGSATTVYSTSVEPPYGFFPCLLDLGDRVHLYFLTYDADAEEIQVRCYRTVDQGDNWDLSQLACLDAPIDDSVSAGAGAAGFSPRHMRVAQANGTVLLVLNARANDTTLTTRQGISQWASSDRGLNFTEVETTYSGAYVPDAIVLNNLFCVIYLDFTDLVAKMRRVASAFTPLSAASEETLNSGVFDFGTSASALVTNGELSACAAPDGSGYVYLQNFTESRKSVILATNDGGDDWDYVGAGDMTLGAGDALYLGSTASRPQRPALTWQGGRLLMLHTWFEVSGSQGNSLGCAYFGGWTAVTMPLRTGDDAATDQQGYFNTWIPFDYPDDVGWTVTPVGTGTDDLDNGVLELDSDAASAIYYTSPSITDDVAQGIKVHVSMDLNGSTDTSISSPRVGLRIVLADGVDDYEVFLAFHKSGANTTYRVTDVNAGSVAVGADQTIGTSDAVTVKIFVRDGNISTWHGAQTTATDMGLVQGLDGEALTSDTGAPSASGFLRWGHLTNLGANTTQWREVFYAAGPNYLTNEQDHAGNFDNPDSLVGEWFSTRKAFVDAGLFLQGIDGPAERGESWTVEPAYPAPVERIFPSVAISPRLGWESADEEVQSIALSLDQNLTEASRHGNSAVAIVLMGINWRFGRLQRHDGVDWETILEIDTAEAVGCGELCYVRNGNAITPDTTADAGDAPRLAYGEAVGWTWEHDDETLREVTLSTEGLWDTTTARNKRPTVVVSGADDADPADGTQGALWPPQYAAFVLLADDLSTGYRLIIDPQGTVSGTLKVGKMVIGPAIVPDQCGDARSDQWSSGTEVTTSRSGITRSKKWAPPVRTRMLSWDYGVNEQHVGLDDADYYDMSDDTSFDPVGVVRSSVQTIEGLFDLVAGAGQAVVHVDRVPTLEEGGDEFYATGRRHRILYGTIAEDPTVTTLLGDEGESEVRQVQLVIREEK